MSWDVERTDSFKEALKEHKKNNALLQALDKKIQRLIEDPISVEECFQENFMAGIQHV